VIVHRYAQWVYNGQWFTPLREALDAFVDVTQYNVTGEAQLKLFKGRVMLVGRRTPHSLYHEDYATFGASEVYNHADVEGLTTERGNQNERIFHHPGNSALLRS